MISGSIGSPQGQHGGKAVDAPMLGIAAVLHTDDVDDVNGDGPAGGCDPHQVARMDSGDRLARRHLVAFRHLIVDRHLVSEAPFAPLRTLALAFHSAARATARASCTT